MATTQYWEENGQNVKYENYKSNEEFPRAVEQLNFTAPPPSEDEADYPPNDYLKKGKQDPMSHRIIEKRRRDRMNNCLADLSRLIPPEYLKKGRGRVEKTEIIEMSIRHIKHLQERANAAEKQVGEAEAADHFMSGYQEAVAEAIRFLVETQGYGPNDGLCVQLATHLRRHFEHITKGKPLENRMQVASSSETASSSSSPHSYVMKARVIARAAPPEVARYEEPYESPPEPYAMDCDRVSEPIPLTVEERSRDPPASEEPLPLDLDVRQQPETTLRNVRKTAYTEDYLHSYKFKNSIERRFSRSQDCEVHDMSMRSAAVQSQAKAYSLKRRRAAKLPVSTSTSNSGSTEEARDTSPQDTSSESPHYHYEKPVPSPSQLIPVFALNALGKFYIPLSVDYACLSRHLDNYDALDARAVHHGAQLHPITINVDYQPCMNYQLKREPNRDWRAE